MSPDLRRREEQQQWHFGERPKDRKTVGKSGTVGSGRSNEQARKIWRTWGELLGAGIVSRTSGSEKSVTEARTIADAAVLAGKQKVGHLAREAEAMELANAAEAEGENNIEGSRTEQ